MGCDLAQACGEARARACGWRDFLTHCLSRTICAFYWFHPLVWAAWRRLRLEAERACDDAVLQEDDPRDYASLLLAMAQRSNAESHRSCSRWQVIVTSPVRVSAILDDSHTRGRVGRGRAIALIVTGMIAISGIAPIAIARRIPQTQALGVAAPPQSPAAASIRRLPSSVIKPVDGRIVATNVSLRQLLIFAFGVRDIDNAPWWVEDRFDLVTNATSDLSPGGSKSLQSPLIERFKLVAHRGSKEFPINALVLARPGGPGPRIAASKLDCSIDVARTCGLSSASGRLTARGVTMEQFAKHLRGHVGATGGLFDRQVIDLTGLGGRFDFALEWTPDTAAPTATAQFGVTEFRPFPSLLQANAPRFLSALREQLGLAVDSQLALETVLVIDNIARPAEN